MGTYVAHCQVPQVQVRIVHLVASKPWASALLLGPVGLKEAEHTKLRTCTSPASSLSEVQGSSWVDTQFTAFSRKQNLGFLPFSRWGKWGTANAVPCVPKPAPALGALGLCQIQPQTAHSGVAGRTGGVQGVGRQWGHGEQWDRLWSQLMSGFLWYPSERVFNGRMGRMEQVPQGCWVIQWECNFGVWLSWLVCFNLICMQNLFMMTSVMKKISQLPNKQYSQQGEQLSAATFVPPLPPELSVVSFSYGWRRQALQGQGKWELITLWNGIVAQCWCFPMPVSGAWEYSRASRVLQYYPLLFLEALEIQSWTSFP